MKVAEWEEKGKVLSFVELQVIPEGFENPYNTALVEIDNDGPKIICWTTDKLEVEDIVAVTEYKGKYLCSPRPAEGDQPSKSDRGRLDQPE